MNSSALRSSGLVVILALALALSVPATAQIQVISSGEYKVPETISLAPAGFGPYGGTYFIVDYALSEIWMMPAGGGPPVLFLNAPIEPVGDSIIGGTFLPSTPDWGADAGKFLVASETSTKQPNALLLFDGSGNQTPLAAGDGFFSIPLVAPANFGSYGSHLFVADEFNGVYRVAPTGTSLTPFYLDTSVVTYPFGLEFTPSGWGAFGNRLLVSDSWFNVTDADNVRWSSIVAVDAQGGASLFASIPLPEIPTGDNGLRQMLLAPNDYFLDSLGIPGRLLLVSVSGSPNGLGYLGELLALDSTGTIVGHLQVGSILAKFDPRGQLITSDGRLLVADSSDPILQASAHDFVPGREDRPPLAIKQEVLEKLIALRAPVTDKQDGKKLDDAIGHLSASVAPALWIDPSHPQPKSGATVFREEKDAVNKLDGLIGDKHSTISGATLQGFINRLVQADEVLALTGIIDALSAHVDAKKIAQANQELTNGNVQATKGKPESAIEQYRNAWSHALKS
jgi:hypothetical protein